MNLILHHALKDLRAVGWWLAAWAGALLALAAADASGGDRATPALAGVMLGLAVLRAILTWLIAIRIVHADPLDSSEAFWLTRPLSAPALLTAKGGLVALVFAVIPSAIAATLFLRAGFPASAVPRLAAGWLLPELVLLMPIVLIASLTRDIARNVIAVILILGAWFSLQKLSGTITPALFLAPSPLAISAERGGIWTLVLFVAGLCTLTAVQYLTRRLRAVAIAAVAAAIACAGFAWAWPARAMMAEIEHLQSARSWMQEWAGGAGVGVEVVGSSVRLSERSTGSRTEQVLADLRISGLDDGVVIDSLGDGRSRWTLDGSGETLENHGVGFRGLDTLPGVAQTGDNRLSVERAIGARLVRDPAAARNAGWGGFALVTLDTNAYDRYRAQAGRFNATFDLVARRLRVAAAIPLKRAMSASVGDVVFSIADVRNLARSTPERRDRPGFAVELQMSSPRLLSKTARFQTGFLLRNRRRGEAEPLVSYRHRAPGSADALAAYCLLLTRLDVARVNEMRATAADVDVTRLDEGWLADAELVLLSIETLGRLTRQVSIADFRLPARMAGPRDAPSR